MYCYLIFYTAVSSLGSTLPLLHAFPASFVCYFATTVAWMSSAIPVLQGSDVIYNIFPLNPCQEERMAVDNHAEHVPEGRMTKD
ncbi:Hypothetical protein NTJ_01238 [Nesidiocoris tenuis]|nr:Hypothetical protein NTJ_01238 [Nesidiocoris tenuis]